MTFLVWTRHSDTATAQYPVGEDKDGNIIMGFYAGHTHSIIPCDDCLLGDENNSVILTAVKQWMKDYRVRAYNENIHKGTLRHILIRTGFHTDEIMVCLVTKKMLRKEAADGLVRVIERLNSGSSASDNISSGSDNNTSNNSGRKLNIASLVVNINKEDTNVILGRECVTLYGRPYIEDYIGDIKFQISPLSFFQVNPKQTEVLYNKALEFANLTGNEAVWDLYCGIGTISLFLAKNAGMVYGVEIVPQAIEDAKNNAGLNGIDNAEFFVGKAEEVVTAFYESRKADDGTGHNMTRPDVIVVDPPRKGCDEKLLDTIVTMSPQRVVYVSCDSATLARDLKVLSERGYKIVKVQPVDQFGNTVHVETVALLSKGAKGPVDFCSARTEVERRMVDNRKVKVDFSLEDMDLSEFKGKATYEQIKAYVLEQTGLKVSSLYIAQIKKKCGLDVGENFNLAKSENARQPKCTPKKEEAIMQAFKHFGIV